MEILYLFLWEIFLCQTNEIVHFRRFKQFFNSNFIVEGIKETQISASETRWLGDLKMIEKQRMRVERAVSDMINDIYKTHFKKMQFDMHVCCAHCCEDQRATLENVQNCIENCSIPLARAQDYLQHELGQFQGQLQHCIMQCSDNIHNKMPPNPSDTELAKYQYQFERCTVTCVDKHIGLIPNMMKTIKTVLARGPQPKA